MCDRRSRQFAPAACSDALGPHLLCPLALFRLGRYLGPVPTLSRRAVCSILFCRERRDRISVAAIELFFFVDVQLAFFLVEHRHRQWRQSPTDRERRRLVVVER